ncbi:hypothetical protein [Pseudoalteromonas gelatinilytica]
MNFGEQVEHIVSHPCMDRFTVKEVRASFFFLPSQKEFKDLSELRRAIYAELLKYEKRGWLKKSVSAKKGITTYTKTEIFDIPFEPIQPNNIQTLQLPELQNQEIRELYTRLNDYKNDLLEGIGKADEFRSLREIYPHLHNEFQPEYNKVRESNSRLLGKIDALEKTLSKLQHKEE